MIQIKTDKIFSAEIRQRIAGEIESNNGNEVFFHGKTNDSGDIVDVEPLAWGNEQSAPALLKRIKPGDVVIHNHPSGDLTPSTADVQIASMTGNQGVGFYIVDNSAEYLKIVVDKYIIPKRQKLSIEEITRELDEKSKTASLLPDYESRPGQIEMAIEAAKCFNEGNFGLIEAGTGTGKSLAYLIPAIKWAVRNKERVLISTKTINLQEQLVFKDILLLKKVLDEEFSAILVKGRGNYACLRKMDSEERDLGLFSDDDDIKELKSLINWSKKTSDGSLSDLNYIPKSIVWDRVKCESDTCTGIRCQFYEDCFLVNDRRKAARADILIVNHHLLFADISLRSSLGTLSDVSVLPPYTRVIIDEAHHIEDVSTEYFGSRVSQVGFRRLFSRLQSFNKKGEPRGQLHTALIKLRKVTAKPFQQEIISLISVIADELTGINDDLVSYSDDVFLDVLDLLQNKSNNGRDDKQFRMDKSITGQKEWQELILVKARGLIGRMHKYKMRLRDFLSALKDINDELRLDLHSLLIEIEASAGRIELAADSMNYLLFEKDENYVKWIELTGRRKSVKICSAPILVAEQLKNTLFSFYDTVIMTSATLTVGGNFNFIKARLGIGLLDRDRITMRLLPSPFDFKNRVIIGVPTDNYSPGHPQYNEVNHKLIADSLKISRGRAFVLFTSYYAMKEAYNEVSEKFGMSTIRLLIQGSDTRHNLLSGFRDEASTALFGTDSFWEGVDVVGESLESIIIARLPFKVPTVPIEIARREAIEKAGGNSFLEYSVPQAAIKLKQGFGRLIRHKNDRGTILILDNRIISKSYGKIFLDSLPDCRLIADRSSVLLKAFEQFYDEEL